MTTVKDKVIHVDFKSVQNKGFAMIDHSSLIEAHWNFDYVLESTSKYIEPEPLDIDIHIQERANHSELPSEFDCVDVFVYAVEPNTEDTVAIFRFKYYMEYDRSTYTEDEKKQLLTAENVQEEIAATVMLSLRSLFRHVSLFDENILKYSTFVVFNNNKIVENIE